MTAPLPDADVEAIERATVATVAPEATDEIDGWLLAFDRGAIGRAKCAVPLRHARYPPSAIAEIEGRYAARGYPPMFRLPDIADFESFVDALRAGGYRDDRHSLVQIAGSADVRRLVADPQVSLAARPDDAWGEVFLGEGFDPVEGASRVKSLSRAPDALYASIADSTRSGIGLAKAMAVGAVSFAHGWASIHAMRTALAHRRQGLAGRILSALAQAAIDRGYDRIFLQVEENNAGAQSLYARAGFENMWRYAYWQR
jgi:ribosomal protein S18 acetylase RimI-like enzyme